MSRTRGKDFVYEKNLIFKISIGIRADLLKSVLRRKVYDNQIIFAKSTER